MKFNPSSRFQSSNPTRALGRSVNAHRALANTDYRYPGYHDGRMAKGFLHNLEQDARTLQTVLQDEDDIPQWVSWKIYTSADRLQAAARYMEREASLVSNPRRRKPFKAHRNFSPTEQSKIGSMATLGQLSLNNDEQKRILEQVAFIKSSLKQKTGAPADHIGLQKLFDHMPANQMRVWNTVLNSNKSADRKVMVDAKIDALWTGHDGLIPVLQKFVAEGGAAGAGGTEGTDEGTEEPPVVDADGDVASVDGEPSFTWLYLAGGALVLGGGLLLLLRSRKKS